MGYPSKQRPGIRGDCLPWVLGTIGLAVFCAVSLYNYLLFHSLVELSAAIVAFAVFMLFWSSRRSLDNGFYIFVGIACLAGGILDLAHVLTYQGVSVFPDSNGNASIQAKTAGRWIVSLSFLVAPLFLKRKINPAVTLAGYFALVAAALGSIAADIFPDCYVKGVGMTAFQQFSRGLSCLAFLAAGGLLIVHRRAFDRCVFGLLLGALLANAVSEGASAVSTDFFGVVKITAHLSEVVALFLIYKAFIDEGVRRPQDLLYRSLKQSEESLQRQQDFLQVVLGSVEAGILACDADGTLTLFNRATWEIYGLPHDPIPPERWGEHYDLYLPDGRTRMRKEDVPLFRALRGEEVHDAEMLVIPMNGQPRAILVSARPLLDKTGKKRGAVAVMHDITQRKHAEDLLRKKDEELHQSKKLESIGQLAAGIAHEINTPTQFIGDNTRFLLDSFRDLSGVLRAFRDLKVSQVLPPDAERTLEKIRADWERADVDYLLEELPRAIDQSLEGVNRVAAIVRSMKEFAHPASSEKQAIDLNRAIENTVTISGSEWKHSAELTLDLDPALPPVPCLAGEINQVVLNLIINAAHAIADKVGRNGTEKGTITVSTRQCGDSVEIRVQDTGMGIPPAIQSRIFDPFFTTKGVGRGSGQGLALAYTTVTRKHGGTMRFETEPGRGTTFYVTLPLRADGSPADQHQESLVTAS